MTEKGDAAVFIRRTRVCLDGPFDDVKLERANYGLFYSMGCQLTRLYLPFWPPVSFKVVLVLGQFGLLDVDGVGVKGVEFKSQTKI
jgi:hypothetical protein